MKYFSLADWFAWFLFGLIWLILHFAVHPINTACLFHDVKITDWMQGIGTLIAAGVATIAFWRWQRPEVAKTKAQDAEALLNIAVELGATLKKAKGSRGFYSRPITTKAANRALQLFDKDAREKANLLATALISRLRILRVKFADEELNAAILGLCKRQMRIDADMEAVLEVLNGFLEQDEETSTAEITSRENYIAGTFDALGWVPTGTTAENFFAKDKAELAIEEQLKKVENALGPYIRYER